MRTCKAFPYCNYIIYYVSTKVNSFFEKNYLFLLTNQSLQLLEGFFSFNVFAPNDPNIEQLPIKTMFKKIKIFLKLYLTDNK
nr:MAG TPA: hypothetical protein [Caudoviricetes sp.]